MAIQAIGAQPQVSQQPAQRVREDVESSEVQSGDVTGVPQVEETSTGGSDAGFATQREYSRSLERVLHELDHSVRQKLHDAVGDYDVHSDVEVRAIEQELRDRLAEETADRQEAAEQDLTVQAEQVYQTLDTFTSSLKVTLETLMPAVPWEPQIPPEPEDETLGPGGVDLLA